MSDNIKHERELIGELLIMNYARIIKQLDPQEFCDQRHQLIFKALQTGVAVGENVNPITVERYLRKDEFEFIGGREYLIRLASECARNEQEHSRDRLARLVRQLKEPRAALFGNGTINISRLSNGK